MSNEYIVPLGIDQAKLLEGFRDTEKGLDRLEGKANETQKSFNDAFSSGAKGATTMENKLNDVAPSLSKIIERAKELDDTMDGVRKSTEQAVDEKPLNRFRQGVEKIKGVFKSFAQGAKEGFRDAIKEANTFDRSMGEIKKRMDEVKKSMIDEKDARKLNAYGKELSNLADEYKEMEKAATKGLKNIDKETEKTKKSSSGLGSIIAGVFGGNILTGIFNGLVGLGQTVISTTSEFQKMEAVLTNTLGSNSAAKKSMNDIVEFATKTPFQVDELTNSFVKFANRGIVLTQSEMTKLGDIAASQGKSFDQLTEAVLDAQTGEFERLKEFGIRASKSGDEATLSFKGVTKTVKNSDEAIKEAILSFGTMSGVAGGMDAISKTLGGSLSNMSDSFTKLFASVGTLIAPFVSKFVLGLTKIVDEINNLISKKEDAIQTTVDTVIKAKEEADSQQKLLDRYKVLKEKGVNATAIEKKELTSVTLKLRDAFGESIISINKETGAMEINVVATQNLIKQRYLLANQQVSNLALERQASIDKLKILEDEAKRRKEAFDFENTPKAQKLESTLLQPSSKNGSGLRIDNASKEDKNTVSSLSESRSKLGEANKEVEKTKENIEKLSKALDVLGAKDIDLAKIQADQAKELAKAKLEASKTPTNKKEAEKEAKKELAEQKKAQKEKEKQDNIEDELNNQRAEMKLKFARELKSAIIDNIKDETKKEHDLIQENAKRKREDLQNEIKIAEKKGTLTNDVSENYKKLLTEINTSENSKLKELEDKTRNTKLALEVEAHKELISLQKDGLEKTLELINIEYDAQVKSIKEKYKGMTEIEGKLLDELNKQKEQKQKDAKFASSSKNIEEESKMTLAILEAYGIKKVDIDSDVYKKELELAGDNKHNMIAIQKSKDLAIITAKILTAEKLLALNKETYGEGSKEYELALADLEKYKNEFNKTVTDLDKIDLSSIFDASGGNLEQSFGSSLKQYMKGAGKGIGKALGLDDEMFAAMVDSFASAMDAIQNLYSEMIQNQIDEKDRQIEALNESIDQAEEAYNREVELQQQGYANNAENKRKELEALKKEREKEQQEKEKLAEKQKKLAQIQIAVSTAVTLANLIAGAAQAIAAHASIPFVGVAFGLAAAAALVSGYLAIKAKGKEAASTQFKHGGWVEGDSHEKGGVKYRSDNPNAGVIELEGKEFVTKVSSAKKHGNLLEAINNDNFSSLDFNDNSFREMLSDMGISLSTEDRKEALRNNDDLNKFYAINMFEQPNKKSEKYLQSIAENTEVLATDVKEKELVTYENGYKIIKRGNTVRKIQIKQTENEPV